MSSKPSLAGVKQVLAVLYELERLQAEERDLVTQLARLSVVRERIDELARSVPKLLEGMDVASNGNAGWQGRVTWFLRELAVQARDGSDSR